MTNLAGTLLSIGLTPLLGFLSGLRKTGSLLISDGPFGGRLFLEGGRVVGAVFESERGMAAFEAIVLVLGGGEFAFDEDAAERELNLMVESNRLDEHLRRLSEERAGFASVLPSLAVVPSVRLTGGEDDEVTINTAALRLLLEVDGCRSVLDLAHERGLVAAARGVCRLVELGLVTVGPIQTIEPSSMTTSTPRPAMANDRHWPTRDRTMPGAARQADSGVDQRMRRPFDWRGPGRA
jgi:hypothetical protein